MSCFFFVFASQIVCAQTEEWGKKFVAVDGKSYSLNDFSEAEVLVLVFTRNTCPIAVDYQGRLNDISTSYDAKKVVILSVNVDEGPGESIADMKEFSQQESLAFHYIHDPKKILAKMCGAKTTPHVFVFNKKREIVYQGLIDDNFNSAKVTEKGRYLKKAIDACLSGKEPPAHTAPKGCSIRY